MRKDIEDLQDEIMGPIAWDVQVPDTEVFHYTSAETLPKRLKGEK